MNENTEYLQHEINLYKNTPFKERYKGKKGKKYTNYQIVWNNIENHKNLVNIAELHGLHLAELIEIILKHFLKCRKTFKKNRKNIIKNF